MTARSSASTADGRSRWRAGSWPGRAGRARAWRWPSSCSSGGCRTSPRPPGPTSSRCCGSIPATDRRRPAAAHVVVGPVLLHLHAHRVAARPARTGRRSSSTCAGSSVGNLLPGGGAAGLAATYTICRSWGFSRRDISTSAIVTGVWNVLARVALPVDRHRRAARRAPRTCPRPLRGRRRRGERSAACADPRRVRLGPRLGAGRLRHRPR